MKVAMARLEANKPTVMPIVTECETVKFSERHSLSVRKSGLP